MVKVMSRGEKTEQGNIIRAQVSTQAELTTDPECVNCAPTSYVWADDLSFYANKKNDGTWNVVSV